MQTATHVEYVGTPRRDCVLERAGKPIKTPNWISYEITYVGL